MSKISKPEYAARARKLSAEEIERLFSRMTENYRAACKKRN